jgi:hypothetical protein
MPGKRGEQRRAGTLLPVLQYSPYIIHLHHPHSPALSTPANARALNGDRAVRCPLLRRPWTTATASNCSLYLSTESPGASPICSEPGDSVAQIEAALIHCEFLQAPGCRLERSAG